MKRELRSTVLSGACNQTYNKDMKVVIRSSNYRKSADLTDDTFLSKWCTPNRTKLGWERRLLQGDNNNRASTSAVLWTRKELWNQRVHQSSQKITLTIGDQMCKVTRKDKATRKDWPIENINYQTGKFKHHSPTTTDLTILAKIHWSSWEADKSKEHWTRCRITTLKFLKTIQKLLHEGPNCLSTTSEISSNRSTNLKSTIHILSAVFKHAMKSRRRRFEKPWNHKVQRLKMTFLKVKKWTFSIDKSNKWHLEKRPTCINNFHVCGRPTCRKTAKCWHFLTRHSKPETSIIGMQETKQSWCWFTTSFKTDNQAYMRSIWKSFWRTKKFWPSASMISMTHPISHPPWL